MKVKDESLNTRGARNKGKIKRKEITMNKKNYDEQGKNDAEQDDYNRKIKPLDHRAEEIQAGYNCLPQAHCCNYYVVIKSN